MVLESEKKGREVAGLNGCLESEEEMKEWGLERRKKGSEAAAMVGNWNGRKEGSVCTLHINHDAHCSAYSRLDRAWSGLRRVLASGLSFATYIYIYNVS